MRTTILSTLLRTLMTLGLVMVFLPTLPVQASGRVYRVKPEGAENGTCGETWDSACSLQYALNQSIAGDQIWVAAGTYTPTSGTSRTVSFMLKNGVAVYGGFAGSEGNLLQRDPAVNITLLSGDIGLSGDSSDNSYHVVNGNQVDHSSILDGLTISGGNANGEYPYSRGGGMFNHSSDPTLLNVIFSNNSALELGGGIYNYNSNPSLTDVLFSGNFAQQRGGGLYNYTSNPTLLNVSFLGNSAQEHGGGMNSYMSSLTVTNATFSNNTATASGGGMYNFDSNVILTNATFSGNSAKSGAGMYNSNHGDITLMKVSFDGNSALERGGGMYNYLSDPIMTDVTFTGNTAQQHGGGMFNGTSNAVLTQVIFSANTTDSCGGGMNNNDSSPTLNEVTFTDNTAEYGGGIYNWDYSSPTLTDTTFSNNSAVYRGGGMYSTTFSNFNLTRVSFTGNTSQDLGGGMFTADSTPSLNDVTFIENTSVNSGGGLDNMNSNAILTDVTFSGNISKNGGGMNNKYGNPLLTNVTFEDNVAQERGGGMYNYEGDPTLTNVSFTGNTAHDLGGGMFTSTSNLLLDQVNFIANSTPNSGGGIYNSYSYTTLTDVTFSGNTSKNGGGMGSNNSDLILTNVTISGNSAQQRGGGMFTYLGDDTLTNVSIAGNTAEQNGGGMFNSGGSLMLTSATFSNNHAGIYGGGIAIDETNTTLKNTIFWGNTAVTTGAQIYSFHSGMPLINDSVIEHGCPAGSVCTNIRTADPLLGILGDHGGFIQTIPLQTGSSAIDTGDDPTCPATDPRGVTRPQGLHCDIGAYEVYLYSISGHILDTQGIPIPGVTVSDGLGHSEITDDAGYYSIPGLSSGEYTITSTKNGYAFSPTYRTVTINNDNVTSMDFEGEPADGFFKINPADGASGLKNPLSASWSPNSGATYYEFCVDTTNDNDCSTSWVSAGEATSYDFPAGSFLPDTTYFWQVRTVNSSDTTYANENTWWSFTTISHSPADDEKLTSSKVAFDWGDIPDATKYKLQLSTKEDFSTLVFNIKTTESTYYYDSFLKYSQTYYWRIRAKIGDVWGDWVSYKFYSMDPLAAPTLADPGDGALLSPNITLSWNAVVNAAQYKLQVATDSAFTNRVFNGKLTDTFKDFNDLAPGKYYWRVKAIEEGGLKGPWSVVRGFTVTKIFPPVLASPDNQATVAPDVTLSWNTVVGAAQYKLQVSKDAAFTKLIVNEKTTELTKNLTALAARNYYWRLKAIDADGFKSPWSEVRKFTVVMP